MTQDLRRGSYPIQSPEYLPHPKMEDVKTDETRPPLPRSIRALRNSKSAAGHERTLVICLDGTGDQFDHDNSNVVHFVSCLRKHNPAHQVTYYQSGIGTYDKGGLQAGVGAAMDMAVGSGLGIHIKDAYQFLMQNYREGDKICLLGFSRGAYTVRCLAGMLHKVGLLPASNGAQLNFAYKFYKDQTKEGWKMSAEFKRTFCTDVSVYFLGVWDCVASVGFIPRKLPFSKTPTNCIQHFRHAMALDEHRSKFKVCHWQQANPDLKRAGTIDDTPAAQMRRGFKRTGGWFGVRPKNEGEQSDAKGIIEYSKMIQGHGPMANGSLTNSHTSKKDIEQEKLESEFDRLDASRQKYREPETDALEVWFMGAHADVGGGAEKNEKRHKLAQIPLRWMIRQCFDCDTGILFSTGMLAEMGIDVYALWPTYATPVQPIGGPTPSVQTRYDTDHLPALRHRSALIHMQTEADEQEWEEEEARFREKHQYALLPESTEDHFDARATVNDQLVQARGWWVLEFWPIKVRVLAKDGNGWVKKVALNMGRHRAIREHEPNMHWSVRRMMDEGRYKMKVRQDNNTHWNVVV